MGASLEMMEKMQLDSQIQNALEVNAEADAKIESLMSE